MTDLPQSGAAEELVGRILDELAGRIRRGEDVDLSAYAGEHPEHAEQIRRLGPTLQAIAAIDQAAEPAGGPAAVGKDGAIPAAPLGTREQQLGDYHIVREVGRGGMGVVYEAQQLSLRRRVALKVLPFAAVLDPRQVARFKNEALAAAQLFHPHIVEVFAVGCERSVHFYAMRFIDGPTLAQVIGQLRQDRSELPAMPVRPIVTPASANASNGAASGDQAAALTQVLGSLSTNGSVTSREFFQSAAVLARKVAQALDYAHQQGIVHRDIKPGNIMIDGAAEPWVTDFGLAHIESDVSLTLSGDVLGTLRYASPEQALGKRGVIDHRSDIYSLGVTLYELLTQQPAFPETDRQRLLQQIATEDPPPLREINPQVPGDLETIVLKTTAKQPQERYETARQLADDLQRFLDHEPIKARRPTMPQRISKWALRHTALVWSASAILLVSTIALAVSTILVLNEQSQTSAALTRAQANFDEAERQKEEVQHQMRLVERARDRADREQGEKEVQRQLAEKRAREAQRAAYSANMRFAFQQHNNHMLRDVQGILTRQIPEEGVHDVRGLEWRALQAQIDARCQTLGHHEGVVHDIVVFPDGRTIATAGDDGVVRVWDAEELVLVREFPLQDSPVYTVGVSPDGNWLAYGSGRRDDHEPKYATLIDARSGEVLRKLNTHKNSIRQIRFSPDGRFLASSGLQEKVSIWEFTEGTDGRSYDLPCQQEVPPEYFELQFLDDSSLLTEFHERTGYRVWDVLTGEPIREFPGLEKRNVHAGSWNGTHGVLACSASRRQLTVRSESGEELGNIDVGEYVSCSAFSALGRLLSVGTEAGRIHTFKLSFDGPKSQRTMTVDAREEWQVHQGSVTRLRFVDEDQLISAGVDGQVLQFRPFRSSRTESPFAAPFKGTMTSMSASPANDLMAWSDPDGRVILADRTTGQIRSHSQPLNDRVIQLAWSADGTHLAAVSKGGRFLCWLMENGDLSECLSGRVQDFYVDQAGLAISRDGSRLYIAGDRGADGIHVWDVPSQTPVAFLPTLYPVRTLIVSPDDQWLVGAGEGIFVFDRITNSPRHVLPAGGFCTSLCWAADENKLITGYKDGVVRLWDLTQGTILRVLPEYDREDAAVWALLLSQDGRTLVAGGGSGQLRFWRSEAWDYIGAVSAVRVPRFWDAKEMSLSPAGDAIDLHLKFCDEAGRSKFSRLPLLNDVRSGVGRSFHTQGSWIRVSGATNSVASHRSSATRSAQRPRRPSTSLPPTSTAMGIWMC